jgi:hypothetical protein
MLKFALAVLLPLSIIFYGAYHRYLSVSPLNSEKTKSGTLEKLVVVYGGARLDIDLGKLGDLKTANPYRLQFDAARDSFFSIKVFNGELRGPLPGTLPIVSKGNFDLPVKLSRTFDRLAIESVAWGEYELSVKDAASGFTLFNIEGHEYQFDPAQRSLSISDGRLLLSKEFAEELGRLADEGKVVGSFSLNASMRQVEVSEITDGNVVSDSLPGLGNPETGGVPGPDVVVGDLSGLAQFGTISGTQVGLAVGTDSCNFGTVDLHWLANPDNDHPVIPQNLYRMAGGPTNDERFEQIGQSNVKHAFEALTENICSLGCNGTGGTALGSGCSDPYSASLNSGQGVIGCSNCLGSRAWINPFTGAFPRNDSATPNNSHTGHTHAGPSHRILTEAADLNTSLNGGAKYYAEAQYVTPHEYSWCVANPTQCNMNNNVSYRRFNVSGTSSPFAFGTVAGETTQRMKPAVNAWTGATLVEIKPDAANDGIGIVAYKVTNPSASVWHYEYAVYNQNLDRGIQTFTVPLGGGNTISNIGFHAPPQQPGWAADGTVGGAGYSSTPWAVNQTASAITWSSETFAQNQNANAIRWGTLYNFRFDSNKPPKAANATVGFFKTGSPINVAIQVPSGPAVIVSISGRVTTIDARGIGLTKITVSDGVNNFVTYSNSFGFYRFDSLAGGVMYTITASKLRNSFAPKQLLANNSLSSVNFISGQ